MLIIDIIDPKIFILISFVYELEIIVCTILYFNSVIRAMIRFVGLIPLQCWNTNMIEICWP